MRILPRHSGGLRLRLDTDEGALLGALTSQLIALLDSHSGTALDPDPFFASLEVGGSDTTPEDPALARLLPDAYADDADASQFRRITEQGLLNRKLQDALVITRALGIDTYTSDGDLITDQPDIQSFAVGEVELEITTETLPAWVRTITALRLAIAARIGLEEEADHDRLANDEEARGTVFVFDWLAALLDSILHLGESGAEESETDGSDTE